MNFDEKLQEYITRIKNLKSKIKTEEATKTSMIMPFFNLLGYDVFNPLEFVPEFTADVGIKKGEKVDYAIMDKKNNPIILIEAKCCGENLNKHGSQLFRYFTVTSAKFAILTNGLIYQFYTDLDEQNKMDKNPFLVINLLSMKENSIADLQKFQKSEFKINEIIAKATELKYNNQIKQFLSKQFTNPDDNFVTYVISDFYNGRKTQRVIDDFRPLVKKAFSQLIIEKTNERLQNAISNETEVVTPKNKNSKTSKVENSKAEKENLMSIDKNLESFFIVKSIIFDLLCGKALSYENSGEIFVIFIDNSPEKWICKINFVEGRIFINFSSNDKEFSSRQIRSQEDIYFYKNILCQAVKKFMEV